jgi:hypothetical protein
MNKLQSLFEMHKGLTFPEFPQDDRFSEWVENLIEVDGYYAGIVSSAIKGKYVRINLGPLQNLKDELPLFKDIEEDDRIYQNSIKYLSSLENILRLLNSSDSKETQ